MADRWGRPPFSALRKMEKRVTELRSLDPILNQWREKQEGPKRRWLRSFDKVISDHETLVAQLIVVKEQERDDPPGSRQEDLRQVILGLLTALDHHARKRTLLDEVHYAREIALRVVEGDTYEEALWKFADPDEPYPGEKCRNCKGTGEADHGHYAPGTCSRCRGTGLEPRESAGRTAKNGEGLRPNTEEQDREVRTAYENGYRVGEARARGNVQKRRNSSQDYVERRALEYLNRLRGRS